MSKTNGAADRLAEIALHYGAFLVILLCATIIGGTVWALNHYYG